MLLPSGVNTDGNPITAGYDDAGCGIMILYLSVILHRRGYLSVAAAAIYMASQASEFKKSQKGKGGGAKWVVQKCTWSESVLKIGDL